jgi:hemerythrin-like domain-containing protein
METSVPARSHRYGQDVDMNQPTQDDPRSSRRAALTLGGAAAAAAAAFALGACGMPPKDAGDAKHEEKEKEGEEKEEGAEVTPGEDLMQEHGLLERVLLVYETFADRFERGEATDVKLVVEAAGIVRSFVEDYHEKQEEDFVFPALLKTDQAPLVQTLLDQHKRGRVATDGILHAAAEAGADKALPPRLRAFIRMYRPHAAREETVLLPAFRRTLDDKAYRELGEKFEEREHQKFGEGGFEDVVARVAKIEAALGVDDLAKFTIA